MNLKIRRVLTALFVILFFVSAPAIILMTAGYRYDPVKNRVEKTGVLWVVTKPDGAGIELNGVKAEAKTPARIRRLFPGTFQVLITKEGFRPWTGTVAVSSNATTFLQDVVLFREGVPLLQEEIPVETAVFSPDRSRLAVLSGGAAGTELRILDLRGGSAHVPFRSGRAGGGAELLWSPDGRRLLLTLGSGRDAGAYLWDPDKPSEIADLEKRTGVGAASAFWSEDGRAAYVSDGRGLFTVDLRTMTAIETGPAVEAMAVSDGAVYGVFSDGTASSFVRRPLRGDAFTVVGALPAGSYRFMPSGAGRLLLSEAGTGKLFLIDPGSDKDFSYLELRGSEAAWSEDGRRLLYWNGFELHLLDARGERDEIVTRLGRPIAGAAWHPKSGAILYSDGQAVFASQGGTAAGRNSMTIARLVEIVAFAIEPSADRLWIVGSIGDREGVWMMRLR